MELEAPRITVYYRFLSNIDEKPLTEYKLVNLRKNLSLNFGHINVVKGGESPYIIEFDIWNNEPAFAGGMLPIRVKDAIRCSFEVWDNEYLQTVNNISSGNSRKDSYILARCVTKDPNSDWLPIAGIYSLDGSNIVGNVDVNNFGVLTGQPGGDHTKIQVKMKIPPMKPDINTPINDNFNFVFNFEYEYE